MRKSTAMSWPVLRFGVVRVAVVLVVTCGPEWVLADAGASARLAAGTEPESAWHIARWALATNDHQGLPCVVVDKVAAQVLVFQADGRMVGQASALLGLVERDDAVSGMGNRSLASILPHERTTPAGRFVAHWGRNLKGCEILWVDYDGAVSLRSLGQLITMIDRLGKSGAGFQSLSEAIDTTTAGGRLVFHVHGRSGRI